MCFLFIFLFTLLKINKDLENEILQYSSNISKWAYNFYNDKFVYACVNNNISYEGINKLSRITLRHNSIAQDGLYKVSLVFNGKKYTINNIDDFQNFCQNLNKDSLYETEIIYKNDLVKKIIIKKRG